MATTATTTAAAAAGKDGDPSVHSPSLLPTLEQVKLEERSISLPRPEDEEQGASGLQRQRSRRHSADGGGGNANSNDDNDNDWRTREAPAALPPVSSTNPFVQNNAFIRAAEKAASRVRRAAAAMAAVAVEAAAAAPGQARQAIRHAEARRHAPRLFLELEFTPHSGPSGPLTARAPVRFRQHLMPFADALISGVDGALPNPQAAAAVPSSSSASAAADGSASSSSRAAWASGARVGATFTARARGIDPTKPSSSAADDAAAAATTTTTTTVVNSEIPFFSAYKLYLSGARPAFAASGLKPCRWCPENKRAAVVFESRALSAALRAKHRLIYSPMLDAPVLLPRARAEMLAGGGPSSRNNDDASAPSPPARATTVRQGALERGDDLVWSLLKGGRRAGEPRYFTYALTKRGQFCCGETGAGILADVMSKHALHSGVAEEVLCAGEFCVVPREVFRRLTEEAARGMGRGEDEEVRRRLFAADDGAWDRDDGDEEEGAGAERQQPQQQGDLVLVLDNNSGTYRPPPAAVALTARLLRANLPGLRVAAIDATVDPRLSLLHARVPSREVV